MKMIKKYKVSFDIESTIGAPKHYKQIIRKAITAALTEENVNVPCVINVLLTNNEGIQKINSEFRNTNVPTDVLSFPMNELIPGKFFIEDNSLELLSGRFNLGDMVISCEKIAAQAKEFGNTRTYELSYLVIHSCLHLLGYDHVDEADMKKQMRKAEKRIMNYLSFDN